MRDGLEKEKANLISVIKEGMAKKESNESVFTIRFCNGKMVIEISADAVAQINVIQNRN